ncbi:MAG: CDP-alcohol phosphatidyltransferase family protein [Dehalococcoidia bacterium]
MSAPPSFTPLRIRAKVWATRYFSAPIARVLIAMRVTPNMITFAGFVVSCVSAYVVSEGHLLIGGVIMLAGAIMDMFDGAVARMTGTASRFGAFFDSVMDRLGEAAVLFGLLVFYVQDAHTLGAYLAFGAMVASIMVSYSRARAEGLGVEGDVGFMGRPERIVVLGAGLLLGYPMYALGLILAVAGVTTIQRTIYVWRKTR